MNAYSRVLDLLGLSDTSIDREPSPVPSATRQSGDLASGSRYLIDATIAVGCAAIVACLGAAAIATGAFIALQFTPLLHWLAP